MPSPRLRPWLTLWVSVLAVIGISGVDSLTGVEMRVYPLYFAPIAAAAWYGPKPAGWLLPILCSVAWAFSNALSAELGWSRTLWFVNSCTQTTAFLTVGVLIRQVRQRLEHEQHVGRTDPLTGLANSLAFHEYGNVLVASSARASQPLTLAYIDLDDFKAVNDSHGHLAGDRVLKQVADVLREQLRMSDLAARLGGDEFAVLLPNTDATGAHAILERVRSALLERIGPGRWNVSASMGAIGYTHAPGSLEAAIQRADGLMYTAKHSGKNRIHIVDAGMSSRPPHWASEAPPEAAPP